VDLARLVPGIAHPLVNPQIWKNGVTVRQKDGTVKFVPPLEPLAVRVISPLFLSENERAQIADLASRGHGPTAIGQLLGRAPSTISRELRRNLHRPPQRRSHFVKFFTSALRTRCAGDRSLDLAITSADGAHRISSVSLSDCPQVAG
jgi:hypothetical protein